MTCLLIYYKVIDALAPLLTRGACASDWPLAVKPGRKARLNLLEFYTS